MGGRPLYGHLLPGSEAEAVALVDAYLGRSDVASSSRDANRRRAA
jgi:hypothetical protein